MYKTDEERRKLIRSVRKKTAGEVRFIKDQGSSADAWAWGGMPPSERNMDEGHQYSPKLSKELAKILRATVSSLGHALSAYRDFTKLKSRDVSPDGSLGGRGYIMQIKDMRKQYMNITEALSALSDTIYDEITADHWSIAKSQIVEEIISQAEEIKDDPEQWAEEQKEDADEEIQRDLISDRIVKKAFVRVAARRLRGER